MSPIAQSYAQLGVMLFANVLFCWYPIYYWSTYIANDNRDGGVLIIGLFIALITWLPPLTTAEAQRSGAATKPKDRANRRGPKRAENKVGYAKCHRPGTCDVHS